MKQLLQNIKAILILITILSVGLLAGIVVQQHRSQTSLMVAAGENRQTLKSRYAKAGSILTQDEVYVATSVDGERLYAEDPLLAESLANLVGDYTHFIQNSLESQYQGILLGTERNPFYQLLFDVTGRGLEGDDIILTLDSRLQAKAYELLGDMDGSVAMINYKTGDVLALVSKPSTSPDNIISYTNIPDTALFNRAIMGSYYPGSSYKFVTAASYVSSMYYDPEHLVECLGHIPLIGVDGVTELGEGHGEINMKHAFEVSCNHFFGDIGIVSGDYQMEQTAEAFGYNKSFTLDRLSVQTSKFATVANDDEILSWLSIGQPVGASLNTATPLHMAMMAGAVANNGVMMTPHIVDSLINPLNQAYQRSEETELATVLDHMDNLTIKELMLAGVESGGGKQAAVEGYKVAGKTGTAQVEGQDEYNAIFLGYVDNASHPYAIAVISEDAGYGSTVSAPIASELFQLAITLNSAE